MKIKLREYEQGELRERLKFALLPTIVDGNAAVWLQAYCQLERWCVCPSVGSSKSSRGMWCGLPETNSLRSVMKVMKLHELWKKTHQPITENPIAWNFAVKKAKDEFELSYKSHLWALMKDGSIRNYESLTAKDPYKDGPPRVSNEIDSEIVAGFVTRNPVGYDGMDVAVEVTESPAKVKAGVVAE